MGNIILIDKLEPAVDGAPSQICTLKFMTPAPQSLTLRAWSRPQNENSIQYVLYLLFLRTHTKVGIKIFEIDFVIKI